MQNKKDVKEVGGLLPKIAKKIAQKSIGQVCFWWLHQPKVPEGLKEEKNKK